MTPRLTLQAARERLNGIEPIFVAACFAMQRAAALRF
jgi:hypothetical protein